MQMTYNEESKFYCWRYSLFWRIFAASGNVISPVDGAHFSSVPLSSVEDLNDAVIAAKTAFTKWSKTAFNKNSFDKVRDDLKNVFGVVTLYRNSPAEGAWLDKTGTNYDELITAEAIADNLDQAWCNNLNTKWNEHLNKRKWWYAVLSLKDCNYTLYRSEAFCN